MPSSIRRPVSSWPRLDGVDLLRGLAICFVLMNHVNMQLRMNDIPYTRGLPPQLVSSLVWNGQFGVQIFFAVSGFLITATSLRRWKTLGTINVREFYQLRFARIAPLLLALLTILSVLHLAHVPHFIISHSTGGLPRALLGAVTFTSNWLEAHRGYLPGSWDVLWSLSVEEMFYLFFPLLCRLLPRKGMLVALMVFFVVMGPFARSVAFNLNAVWREYSYLGGMDAIAMGCLTAIALRKRRLPPKSLRVLAGAGSAILIVLLCFSLRVDALGLDRSGLDMSLVGLGTCLVITAAAQGHWHAPKLISPLLLMGRKSYEIYLTHMFVVIAMFQSFVAFMLAARFPWSLFLLVLCVATALGSLVARYYSEPVNYALRKRWGEGRGRLGSVVELH